VLFSKTEYERQTYIKIVRLNINVDSGNYDDLCSQITRQNAYNLPLPQKPTIVQNSEQIGCYLHSTTLKQMIGFIILYFIGKKYYVLAEENQKHKWGFAILGIVFYYIGTFLGGLIIALYIELGTTKSVEEIGDTTMGIIGIPFGIALSIGIFKLLEKNWKSSLKYADTDILDEDQTLQEKL